MGRARTLLQGGVLAAGAVAAGWLAAPGVQLPPALVASRQNNWATPVLPRPADQAALAAGLAAAPIWGAALAAATTEPAPPAPDMRWRLAAVFGPQSRRGLLLVFADPARPAQRLFVGDKLPGGYEIASIGEQEICVRINGGVYRLGVERRER